MWVDLTGNDQFEICTRHYNTVHYTYPIALAQCTEDADANNMVNVEWFGPFKWKGTVLSDRNSQFAFFWRPGNEVRAQDRIKSESIVPFAVHVVKHAGERVTIAPASIKAVVDWCEENKKRNKRKRKAASE